MLRAGHSDPCICRESGSEPGAAHRCCGSFNYIREQQATTRALVSGMYICTTTTGTSSNFLDNHPNKRFVVDRSPGQPRQWSILCCLSSISSRHSFPSRKYRGTCRGGHQNLRNSGRIVCMYMYIFVYVYIHVHMFFVNWASSRDLDSQQPIIWGYFLFILALLGFPGTLRAKMTGKG